MTDINRLANTLPPRPAHSSSYSHPGQRLIMLPLDYVWRGGSHRILRTPPDNLLNADSFKTLWRKKNTWITFNPKCSFNPMFCPALPPHRGERPTGQAGRTVQVFLGYEQTCLKVETMNIKNQELNFQTKCCPTLRLLSDSFYKMWKVFKPSQADSPARPG